MTDCSLLTWSLYMSSAKCKFVVESLALKQQKTQVFFAEFGLSRLTICIHYSIYSAIRNIACICYICTEDAHTCATHTRACTYTHACMHTYTEVKYTWKDILKEPPLLSPPIFTQISSFGIASPCHVRASFLL